VDSPFFSTGVAASSLELGETTEWGRALERLLVVLFGGLAMYYGFKLFSMVSSHEGELSAKGSTWQFKMVRVGPGVFFGLFGTVIVTYALVQSPTILRKSDGTTEVRGGTPAVDASRSSEIGTLRAIATIKAFTASAGEKPTAKQLEVLRRAVEDLELVQAKVIDAQFGQGSYADWRRLKEKEKSPEFAEAMKVESTRTRFHAIRQRIEEVLE
jgi:hypothetical protein